MTATWCALGGSMFCGDCHAKVDTDLPFCDKCGSDRPVDGWGPDLLPGTVVAGKYLLEERLGSGGMGFVYRARHVELATTFAIKFLHRDLTTAVHKKRFTREARVAAALSNNHTVQVIDFGISEDELYLVMEHVAGPNLATFVNQGGKTDVYFVVELLRQLATALEEAHEQGTIHRDLKPENILLAPARRGLHFKLTDFGIAGIIGDDGERLTRTGMVNGSPGYMSPEQGEGLRDLDGRADLYALGVIAWELLAQRPMFDVTSPMELIIQHMHVEPDSLRALRPPPEVPAAVHDLVDGLICKNREDRFANSAALLQAIAALPAELLTNDPLHATHEEIFAGFRARATAEVAEQSLPSTRQLAAKQSAEPGVSDETGARSTSNELELPTGRNTPLPVTETGRIETLSRSPYGYQPVGNPALKRELQPPRATASNQQLQVSAASTPVRQADDDTAAALSGRQEGTGESLGEVDDIYDRGLAHGSNHLVLGVLGALLVAGFVWMIWNGA